MRTASAIWDVWRDANGEFIGDYKPHARVTVEADWWLSTTGDVVGLSTRGPYRWFQREDESQTETEVPNVKSISIDRSIDTDASTCTITIYNQWHDTHGTMPSGGVNTLVLGRPGYFTWDHGENPEAMARWNQSTNAWNNILVPNALLRTYEGYGGEDKTLANAVTDGNLIRTGTWLVDSVTVNSNGTLTLKCRDMAKLLIEQFLYPPLVPNKLYPLKYARWYFDEFTADFDAVPAPETTASTVPAAVGGGGEIALTYAHSSADAWYGYNANIHGHVGTHSIDGNTDTFALSVGNGSPAGAYCTDYWTYITSGEFNEVYIHPWAGNYTMYVCVYESGAWQSNGEGVVPYDPSGLSPGYVDTEADTPYVARFTIPWETPGWYRLPRTFNGHFLRITFKNHTQSPWGPYYYRVGIREVKARLNVDVPVEGGAPVVADEDWERVPWTFDMAPHMLGNIEGAQGYYVVDEYGKVFVFGDARIQTQNDGQGRSEIAVGIAARTQGDGYWVLERNGVVHSYGNAGFYGNGANPTGLNYFDIAQTHTGNGYYLLRRDGVLEMFGDAVYYGDTSSLSVILPRAADDPTYNESYRGTAIETDPNGMGYWILTGDGQVFAFGTAVDYGDMTTVAEDFQHATEWTACIQVTPSGNGYWILGGGSTIVPFGDAADYGQIDFSQFSSESFNNISAFRRLTWAIVPTAANDGYWVLQADGSIAPFGNAPYYGAPGDTALSRREGNYKDYADIIKELLLYAGFLLYSNSFSSGESAPVHGIIESTGAHAGETPIAEDVFDKKSVMDAINTLKEIVGYIFYCGDNGDAVFVSPNWWASGNIYYETNQYTSFIPEIDEAETIIDYTVSYNDDNLRSEIIIGSEVPEPGNLSTVVTRTTPVGVDILRGMVRPAMWINEVFSNVDEQRIMANLIALHIWFSKRVGSVTCVGNPAIQPNDQVRIYERTTSESYVHYVRSINRSIDLDTGRYEMTVETNWLGNSDNWVINEELLGASNFADIIAMLSRGNSTSLYAYFEGANNTEKTESVVTDNGESTGQANL